MSPSAPPLQQRFDDATLLVLYTDGLTEATRDSAEGERRLLAVLKGETVCHVSNSAEFISAACLGEPSPDDVAILALNFVQEDRWSFRSDDERTARKVRAELVASLERRRVTEDDLRAAEAIFGELIANVASHAPGLVDVALEWRGSDAVLHVLDRGGGYTQPRPERAGVLAESGRGLWLIEEFGGKVTMQRVRGFGTHVSVAFRAAQYPG
jgi:anti-sigma regulatory factor (Ser/Thr protein kinase)